MQEGTKADFRLSMKTVELFFSSMFDIVTCCLCNIIYTLSLSPDIAVVNESVHVHASSALAVIVVHK